MTARKALGDFRKADIPLQRTESTLPKFRPNQWVLAFDQSLASTGWAVVSTDGDGNPYVEKTGMILTSQTEVGGYEDTFARVATIETEMMLVVTEFAAGSVVHEMPATFGKRTDASLASALTLRSVCRRASVPCVGYQAQRVKKAVTGKANATKAEVKSSIKSLVPNVVKVKPNNEHTNDAISVALTHLRIN